MLDIQKQRDERQLDIDQVGVSQLRYPITVLDPANEKQTTTALISMSVDLPHHFKGTHMSRFIEVLNTHRGEVTMHTIPKILHSLKERLEADSAHIELCFPYFVEREAPISKAKALMDYECSFSGSSTPKGDEFVLGIKVPVTSLCPCSKAISDYGAHNQRGEIHIEVGTQQEGGQQFIWLEELIHVAENAASAPVYSLLKREDERFVTMQAYDHPMFVEDMVRSVAVQLRKDSRVRWFRVRVTNFESIHNHSAFACISWSKDSTPPE